MAQATLRTPVTVTPEQYFDGCLFDPAYTTRLFVDELKFPGAEVISLSKEGPVWRRKVRINPPLTGIPGPVKKLVGDAFSYIEEGSYDPSTQRYTYSITPSTASEKTKATGESWFEKDGDKHVLVTKFTVEVKIMMVGGMVEDKILSDLRASLEQAAPFITKFVAEKA